MCTAMKSSHLWMKWGWGWSFICRLYALVGSLSIKSPAILLHYSVSFPNSNFYLLKVDKLRRILVCLSCIGYLLLCSRFSADLLSLWTAMQIKWPPMHTHKGKDSLLRSQVRDHNLYVHALKIHKTSLETFSYCREIVW